jgi:hypothetical protein
MWEPSPTANRPHCSAVDDGFGLVKGEMDPKSDGQRQVIQAAAILLTFRVRLWGDLQLNQELN